MRFTLSERRLLNVRASDYGDPTRYNSRTAAANAEVQAQQHRDAIGVATDPKAAQQVTQAQSQLAGAKAVAANQAAGYNTSFTPDVQGSIDPKTGAVLQQQSQTGSYQVSGQGEIQQAAINRLRESGMTDEQIRTQLATVQPQAQSTMSNTGQQGSFDANGMFIPGSQGTTPVDGNSIEYRRNDIMNRPDIPGVTKAAMLASLAQEEAAQAEKNRATAQADRERAAASSASSTSSATAGNIAASQTNPTTFGGAAAGVGAAMQNLPAEYQFLAPFFQQFQSNLQQTMNDNVTTFQSLLNDTRSSYDKIQGDIDEMKAGYMQSTAAMNGMLEEVKKQNDEFLQKQQVAEEQKLKWEEEKQTRAISKQKAQQHDALVANIALAGGFAQDAGIRGVMESDNEFDQKISDLAQTFTFARTDLAVRFSGMYLENQNNYVQQTQANVKELRGALERLGLQSISSTQARQNAETNLITTAWNKQVDLRSALAQSNLDIAKEIQGVITQSKAEKRQKSQDAMDQIEWLVNTYDPRLVADSIRELAKDVPNLDVNALVNNPTLEIQKMRKSGSGSGGGGYVPPSSGVQPSPMTIDEFLNNKIFEKETEDGMSFSPERRKEYIDANMANFMTEFAASNGKYAAANAPSSGDAAIDEVAQMVVSGTYANAKEASNETGLPSIQIARQVQALQAAGATGDAVPMNQKQQTNFLRISGFLNQDPVVQFARAAPYKASTIRIGLEKRNGPADILAINNYQNGFVDQGAVTRSEDVTLLTERAAPILAKYSTDYWKERLANGALIPEVERAQLLDILNDLDAAIKTAYQTGPYANFVNQGRALGIPEANLRLFQNVTNNVIDDPQMSSTSTFTSNFGYE